MLSSTCSRRSFLGLSAALAGASLLPGPAFAEAGKDLFAKPGTYSATAPGRNGDVTLTATFSAQAIDSIDVDSSETPTVGVAAMDALTQEVIDGQTLAVESVSGATLSCDAFLTALKDCVAQAGGDFDELSNDVNKTAVEYKT